MPEQELHTAQIRPGLHEARGKRVAQVVEAQGRNATALDRLRPRPPRPLVGAAIRAHKHPLLGGLALPERPQHGEEGRGQGHTAAPPGFGVGGLDGEQPLRDVHLPPAHRVAMGIG